MLVIGERINTSRKTIAQAVEQRDEAFIAGVAIEQFNAGAAYIDANAGTLLSGEPDALEWLAKTIQCAVDAPVCIDSPNPAAIERALKVHKGRAIINSITAEEERYKAVLPLVKEYNTGIIALAMSDEGMPSNAEDRIRVAGSLVERLLSDGVSIDDIYVDPLVFPAATGAENTSAVLETIRTIRKRYPGVHASCGLSNVSHGLPVRKLLNQAFLVMAVSYGMDAAILDPLDRRLMALLIASRALLGRDEFCMEYLTAARNGEFEGLA